MSPCVPSWDFDENTAPAKIKFQAHSNSSNSLLPGVPSLDYEVAELTWENGQLAMHGLGAPRVANKPIASPPWDKPHAGGTLESIVNQATNHPQPKPGSWFGPGATASATMTVDALVPCTDNMRLKENTEPSSTHVRDRMGISMVPGCSTRVSSCSGAAGGPRVGITYGSVSESATCGGRDRQVTVDTWDRELGGASLVSPENTFSGQDVTKTSGDDHDSIISRSRSQKKSGDEEGKSKGKYSASTKRSRAAAIHNQSERKRRDKINQRMKTLQKLVPNSSKTDKASMLDEVIEYLKQLQGQVSMMNRMNVPSMMLPQLAMQQQLQMSMMGMGMGMGMGMTPMGVMDINTMNRATGVPPVVPPAAAFMPVPAASWDNPADCLQTRPPDPLAALLACQSQPRTMDAYNWMAAMYQQLQQPPVSKS